MPDGRLSEQRCHGPKEKDRIHFHHERIFLSRPVANRAFRRLHIKSRVILLKYPISLIDVRRREVPLTTRRRLDLSVVLSDLSLIISPTISGYFDDRPPLYRDYRRAPAAESKFRRLSREDDFPAYDAYKILVFTATTQRALCHRFHVWKMRFMNVLFASYHLKGVVGVV